MITPAEPRSARIHPVLRPRTAAEDALLLIVDDLRAGVYEVGSKLPSLRELAAELGISHVNVRAALHRLEHAGVVGVQRGRGGGVTVLELSAIPQVIDALYASVPEDQIVYMVEAWTVLERETMVLASRRADADAIARLRAKVYRLHEKDTENTVEFAERTVQFHILAASVARNQFLARPFSDLLNITAIVFSRQGYTPAMTPARRATTIDHYDRLISAIERKAETEIVDVVRERHILQLEMIFGATQAAELAERSRRT